MNTLTFKGVTNRLPTKPTYGDVYCTHSQIVVYYDRWKLLTEAELRGLQKAMSESSILNLCKTIQYNKS